MPQNKRMRLIYTHVLGVLSVLCLLSNMFIDVVSVPRNTLLTGFNFHLSWFIWATFTIIALMKYPLTFAIVIWLITNINKRSNYWMLLLLLVHCWLFIELLVGMPSYREQYLPIYLIYVVPMLVLSFYINFNWIDNVALFIKYIPLMACAFLLSFVCVDFMQFVSSGSRYGSIFDINPIAFAAGLLINVSGVWFWYFRNDRKHWAILLLVLLYTLLVSCIVILTAARGPIVSFLIVTGLLLLLRLKNMTVWRKYGILLLCVISIFIVSGLAQYAPSIVVQRLSGQADESTMLRAYAYEMALQNPNGLFGSGVGQTDLQTGLGYTHNLILECYYEHGILLLVIIIILTVRSLFAAIQTMRHSNDMARVFVSWLYVFWLCEAQFSGGIYTNWQFWALLAIILHRPSELNRNQWGSCI